MRLSLTQEMKIHDDIVFLKTKVEPDVPTFNPSQQHEEAASISLRYAWEYELGIQCLLLASMGTNHACMYIHEGKNTNTYIFLKNGMQTFK